MNAIHPTTEYKPAQEQSVTAGKGFTAICLASCRKLISQIQDTKEAILAEFSGRLEDHEHLLHLALNEAESLAWESGFPQLVFPTLATEKAQAVAAWHTRQRSVRHPDSGRAFAA